MTIEKGQEWGRVVGHHGGGEALDADLRAELGLDPTDSSSQLIKNWLELPVDLLRVEMTHVSGEVITFTTPTHVVAGSRFRGQYCIVSSTSFVNRRRIFSRAHPNDGRLDWLEMDRAMTLRQRLLFFRRSRTESHLPHPHVCTGSSGTYAITFDKPVRVRSKIDRRGLVSLRIEVIPDGSAVYVPAPSAE